MAKTKILVVDDEIEVVASIFKILQGTDYEVLTAHSGEDALELIKTGNIPQLVISDINMPQMNGYQLYHELKKIVYLPFLFLSTRAEDSLRISAVKLGVYDCILKPFNPDLLKARVQNIVERIKLYYQREERDVLAIAAYPSDIEAGISGTLMRHKENKDHLSMLILFSDEQAAEEIKRSSELLNATCFLPQLNPDDFSQKEIGQEIKKVLSQHKVNLIYTHTIKEDDECRRAVALATNLVAKVVQEIFAYQTASTQLDFTPERFVDITDLLEDKVNLVNIYQSEKSTARRSTDYLSEEMIEAVARFWGVEFARCKSAEPLEVIRMEWV